MPNLAQYSWLEDLILILIFEKLHLTMWRQTVNRLHQRHRKLEYNIALKGMQDRASHEWQHE